MSSAFFTTLVHWALKANPAMPICATSSVIFVYVKNMKMMTFLTGACQQWIKMRLSAITWGLMRRPGKMILALLAAVIVLFKNLQYIYICLIMTWTGYVLILVINIHQGLQSWDSSLSCTCQSCTIHRFTVVMIFFEYGSFPAWYFPYYDTWHSKDMVILHTWLVGYVSLCYGMLVAYFPFFPTTMVIAGFKPWL